MFQYFVPQIAYAFACKLVGDGESEAPADAFTGAMNRTGRGQVRHRQSVRAAC